MKTESIQKNIPKGWRKEPLYAVANILSGATPKTSEPRYWGGDVVWITPKDLSHLQQSYIEGSERKITEIGLKSCSAVLVPINSVVMSSRAPIGYLAINKIPVATNQGCKSIVPNNTLDTKYLFYYLEKNIDDVKRLGTGSTFAEVGKSAVESVEIIFPPIAEQKKIADILSTVDKELQKIDEAIAATEKLKSGLTQQLFDLKGKTSKLGEVTTLITKGTTPTTYGHPFTDEGVNFFKIENIDESGNINLSSCRHISDTTHDFLKRSQLMSGDVLFSIAGALGRITVINQSHLPANVNQALAIIRLKNKDDAKFVSQVLRTDYVMRQVIGNSVQLAQANISLGKLGDVKIPWPEASERERISNIIQTVDEKVDVSKKIKNQLLLLKKGLMQDLLSGKKRTI